MAACDVRPRSCYDGEMVGSAIRHTRDRAELFLLLGVLVLAVAILFLPSYWASSLVPHADAGEYTITAQNLAYLKGYHITLLHRAYPSRYPFGFPLLLMPFYWLPHATLATGIYGVLTYAVLTVVATYVLARMMSTPLAGVIAAVSALLSSVFIIFSHYVLSEMASTALVALSAILLCLAVGSATTRSCLVALIGLGATCGFAMLVHFTNGALVVSVALALVATRRVRAQGWRAFVAFASGPTCAGSILAVYNWATFGTVTATGYRFWRPAWYTSLHRTFALTYALRPHLMEDGGRLTPWGNIGYYVHLFPALVPSRWCLVPLGVGLVVLLRNRRPAARALALFVVLFTLLTVGLYLLYFFQAIRFLMPLIPLMACLIGVGADQGVAWMRRRVSSSPLRITRWIGGSLVCGITVVGLLVGRSTLDESYLFNRYVTHDRLLLSDPIEGQAIMLYQSVVPAGSIIITDLFDPIVEATPAGRRSTIVPVRWVGYESDVAPVKTLPALDTERQRIAAAIAAGTPVFTDSFTLLLEKPKLSEYRLEEVAHGVAGSTPVAIYRVTI